MMTNSEIAYWNDRFSVEEYVYGKEANEYFKQKLLMLTPGKILLPAEGEGRNAVFAARSGWDVIAFDQSNAGKIKAESLARANGVKLDYRIISMADAQFENDSFDAIALIFAHFDDANRLQYHQKLIQYLKPGGTLILEAFTKAHIQNQKENSQAGGPKDIRLLYQIEDLKNDFPSLILEEYYDTEVTLSEGQHHLGKANVIRILGKKPTE